MKSVLKNKRVLLWVFFVVVSIILIAPNPNPSGLVITSVEGPLGEKIAAGEIIYKINDKSAEQELQKEFFGLVKFETNKGTKFLHANGTLGIKAEEMPKTNLKFGLDLKGGITATIKPEQDDSETIQQIISTLQTRINVYGLRETVFKPVFFADEGFVEISIAGGNEQELKNLIESQGKFEAKLPLLLRLQNGEGFLELSKRYSVKVENNSLMVDGKAVEKNFALDGIEFSVGSVQKNLVNATATVFTGDDIKIIFFDPQRSGVENYGNLYRWFFQVQITNEAANRFYWVARNMQTYVDSSGERFLESQISFYLDGKLIDSLNVAGIFRDKPVTDPSISGSAETMQEAVTEKARLQSILRSGALPTKIELVQLSTLSPTLGSDFMKSALSAAIAAIVLVVLVVSTRYRKPKIVLSMVLVSLSEIIIILGIASLTKSTIDLPAIAGIIAAIGVGINDQIVIIDNVLRREAREMTLAERFKKAFFVIFGAAGTIIAAMVPLMIIGFGLLRGFAITTIIGTLVGVLVTRPAFAVVVEKLIKE